MAKPLKILLAVVGVVVVLLIGALVIAAAVFDPNDYRGQITAAVKKQTGRDLALGDIKLSVFPWLKVRLSDVSFSNAPGFGETPMAQVRQAAVGVQLMPLLFDKKVRASSVTLDGLKLDLAKDAEGRTNWADLIKPEDPNAPPEEAGPIKLEDVDIAGITLTGAFITYRDAQAKQAYRLENVNLETGALKPGKPMDIDLSLLAIAEAQKLSADIVFSSTVMADMVEQKATLEALKLGLKAKGEGQTLDLTLAADVAANLETRAVDLDKLKLNFKASMKDLSAEGLLVGRVLADMSKQSVDVDGLKLDFKTKMKDRSAEGTLIGDVLADLATKSISVAGLKLDFKAAMKDLAAQGVLTTNLKAGLDSKVYDLAGLSLNATASGAAVPGGKQAFKLSGNAAYDGAKGTMKFSDGKIGAAGLNITTSISGEGLSGDAPRLSGPVSIAAFNPRELLKALGKTDIKTTDPKVLSHVSLSTRYSGSFKSARFDDLKLKLDDTNMAGSLAVRDFATQALEFALKLDRIDIDRYLAPAEAKPAAPPGPSAAKSKDLNATEIPVQALEKLNASGTLDVGEFKIKGATLKDVRLKIDGPKGAPKLVKLDAKAYGGNISTSTRIVPGARPDYAINTSLSAMQLSPLLLNFAGKDMVSGLGNIKFDITSSGKTVGDARRALNGDLALNFENGAVKGFNLGQIVRKSQAMLRGQTYTETEPQQTDFTAISFAAKIVNGVLKSDQLSAASPLFRLAGNGEIDLVNETINYLASPTVVGTSKGQGGKGLEELAGLTIPIKLTGSLYAPKYKLDLQTALKQKAGDQLRGKVADKLLGGEADKPVTDAELKAKAGEKLNKELGRGLEKLFGGKKKQAAPAEAAPPPPEPAAPAPEAPAAAEPAPEPAPAP